MSLNGVFILLIAKKRWDVKVRTLSSVGVLFYSIFTGDVTAEHLSEVLVTKTTWSTFILLSLLYVLCLTGGSRVAVRLGGRPRGSRLQRKASNPVPTSTPGRWPAAGGSGHVTGGWVRQRKRYCQQWRRAWLEVSQSSPGQPKPTAATQPTSWGSRRGIRDWED